MTTPIARIHVACWADDVDSDAEEEDNVVSTHPPPPPPPPPPAPVAKKTQAFCHNIFTILESDE